MPFGICNLLTIFLQILFSQNFIQFSSVHCPIWIMVIFVETNWLLRILHFLIKTHSNITNCFNMKVKFIVKLCSDIQWYHSKFTWHEKQMKICTLFISIYFLYTLSSRAWCSFYVRNHLTIHTIREVITMIVFLNQSSSTWRVPHPPPQHWPVIWAAGNQSIW